MRQSEQKCSNPNPSNPSLPSGSSEDWIVFRESFLFYLDPDKRETLRAAGDVLFTAILAGGPYRPGEPLTHGRLRALVLDLLFVAQLLREIGEEPLNSEFELEDEDRLARSAPAWAEAVERVARVIEEAVDAGEREGVDGGVGGEGAGPAESGGFFRLRRLGGSRQASDARRPDPSLRDGCPARSRSG